jgi:L-ascorbate metabolism protein UlaG (beta-lactamase superfamily)
MNTTTYNGVRITLFGHSSVCLEYGPMVIYIDPYVLDRTAKPADAIFHTHSHFDHCALPKSILKSTTAIIGRGCKHPGRAVEIGERLSLAPGAIVEVVHAYNPAKKFHPKGFGAGYIFTFGKDRPVRIYVAGDTDKIPEMASYSCDVAIVPIGGTYTMDPSEAMAALMEIKPKIAIPYHYGYLSETRVDAANFKAQVEAAKLGIDVRILAPAM